MNIRKTVRLDCHQRRWHLGSALLIYVLWLAILSLMPPASAASALTPANNPIASDNKSGQLSEATRHRADVLLSRPELSAYRGWIKYLRF